MLLVQFLVLVFTGALWWLARRDLAARPAPPPAAEVQADVRDLEQLCVTLEALVTDLAGRLEALEQRSQEGAGARFIAPASPPVPSVAAPAVPPMMLPQEEQTPPVGVGGGRTVLAPPSPEVAAHASLYALLDAGVTDPAEIARRTGLGRGEVDLILSLRARRAL